MRERTGQGTADTIDGRRRFDAESARRILDRAAALQQRLDSDFQSSYTLDELQQIAAEAGISQDALEAAIEHPPDAPGRRTKRLAWPASPGARRVIVGSAVLVAVFAVLLAFPAVAQVMFWLTIFLTVLVLLGASPV